MPTPRIASLFHRLTLPWLLGLLLSACASVDHSAQVPRSGLVRWQGDQALLAVPLAEQVARVRQRLFGAAALELPLRIDGSRAINAFARRMPKGGYEIVLNAGLLDMVGYDGDQLAFVVAHEISHVALGHLSDAQIAARRRQSSTVDLLSMLADIVVPLSGLALSAGHAMQEAGYSREQEIAADAGGVALMRRAGFDAEGALRFQRTLLRVSNPSQLNLFSSHPPGAERLAALEQAVRTP